MTKLLKIDRSLNREDLVHSNRLWLESDGARVKFTAAPRIGIAYASKRDQNRKWRFTHKKDIIISLHPNISFLALANVTVR